MQNAQNLFETDWIKEFDLFNIPINTFCYKIDSTTTSSDKLKKKLKIKFPKIFSEGLRFCSKVKAKFEVKENVILVFRPKRPVPYASDEIIDKELGRLEKLGVIEKNWLQPMGSSNCICKEKNNKIRICADYSTGHHDCLKEINYPSQQQKKFLQIQMADAHFLSWTCHKLIYKYQWKKSVQNY